MSLALSSPTPPGDAAVDDRSERADRPQRPTLRSDNEPPVLVKEPPPFAVRLSQLLWVLSFVAGGIGVVYLFVVRTDHLPAIAEAIRAVDGSRPEATYTTAADIVFWSTFGVMVALLLVQITHLVAFMSRKPGTRWWQLGTLIAQVGLYALALEMVGDGEQGEQIRRLMVLQVGLVTLALLVGTFRSALNWTARRHDVRRGLAGANLPDL